MSWPCSPRLLSQAVSCGILPPVSLPRISCTTSRILFCIRSSMNGHTVCWWLACRGLCSIARIWWILQSTWLLATVEVWLLRFSLSCLVSSCSFCPIQPVRDSISSLHPVISVAYRICAPMLVQRSAVSRSYLQTLLSFCRRLGSWWAIFPTALSSYSYSLAIACCGLSYPSASYKISQVC